MNVETINPTCPFCRKATKLQTLASDRFHEDLGYTDYTTTTSLLKCETCNHASVHAVYINSDDCHRFYDDEGQEQAIYFESRFHVPPSPTREDPDWTSRLEMKSETAFKDLVAIYRAIDCRSYKLAAMGIRSLFEVIAHEDGASSALPFNKKLDKLEELERITSEERVGLHALVESGNAAVHRKWNPESVDIALLLTILESYIHTFYFKAEDEAAMLEKKRQHSERVRALARRIPPNTRRKVPPKTS